VQAIQQSAFQACPMDWRASSSASPANVIGAADFFHPAASLRDLTTR
jgi:hypothetical protein